MGLMKDSFGEYLKSPSLRAIAFAIVLKQSLIGLQVLMTISTIPLRQSHST
jgi:hypothetical protein